MRAPGVPGHQFFFSPVSHGYPYRRFIHLEMSGMSRLPVPGLSQKKAYYPLNHRRGYHASPRDSLLPAKFAPKLPKPHNKASRHGSPFCQPPPPFERARATPPPPRRASFGPPKLHLGLWPLGIMFALILCLRRRLRWPVLLCVWPFARPFRLLHMLLLGLWCPLHKGATAIGPDATLTPGICQNLRGGCGGGYWQLSRGGVPSGGRAHNPLLPHAYLEGVCVSGGGGGVEVCMP